MGRLALFTPGPGCLLALVGTLALSMPSCREATSPEGTHPTPNGPDGVHVRGVVLAADGSPLVGGGLVTLAEGEGPLPNADRVDLGDDGCFELHLAAPGRFVFSLEPASMQVTGMGWHHVLVEVPAAGLDGLVLRMPRGRISGRVVHGHGEPAQRATVTAWRDEELHFVERFGEGVPAQTDREGRFELDGLPPGSWWVAAVGGDVAMGRTRGPVRLGADAEIDGVEVRLEAAGSVGGRVVDERGEPVARASLFTRDADGTWYGSTSGSTSDDGDFGFWLPAGRYTLLARAPGLASLESEPIEIAAGRGTELELALVPATQLELALLDPGGTSVPARFRVEDAQGRRMTGILAFHERDELFREGFSTLEPRVGPFVPGSWRVIAKAEDGQTANVEVSVAGEPLERVELRLP